MSKKLYKTLSRNDVGQTGSHQSGISVPKDVIEAGILPELPREVLNPRRTLHFRDENGFSWKFQYIYYNDIHHGKPRSKGHDEYRLTCVKGFLRQNDLQAYDEIWFSLEDDGFHIGYVKHRIPFDNAISEIADSPSDFYSDEVVITLSQSWKCIETKM